MLSDKVSGPQAFVLIYRVQNRLARTENNRTLIHSYRRHQKFGNRFFGIGQEWPVDKDAVEPVIVQGPQRCYARFIASNSAEDRFFGPCPQQITAGSSATTSATEASR